MREVLFRGKRIDNGEWVHGYLAGFDLIAEREPESTENATGLYYGDVPYVGFVEVVTDTIGEYTGLTDRNDTKIYEGDILRVEAFSEDGAEKIVKVEFDEGGFCAGRNFLQSWLSWGEFHGEVIGNIYDNPEIQVEETAG